MLAPGLVTEVRRLLSEKKLSQRKIARLVGVSRGTIGAIAAGRRPDYAALRKPDDDAEKPSGPPERCPGCGGMVYLPCRLCRTRVAIKTYAPPRWQDAIEPLGLNLRPDHYARYQQVRAWRQFHGNQEIARAGQCTS
jgi:transcriptional regulator with XRE-family HTH domain